MGLQATLEVALMHLVCNEFLGMFPGPLLRSSRIPLWFCEIARTSGPSLMRLEPATATSLMYVLNYSRQCQQTFLMLWFLPLYVCLFR
jgi:hypothetical protein